MSHSGLDGLKDSIHVLRLHKLKRISNNWTNKHHDEIDSMLTVTVEVVADASDFIWKVIGKLVMSNLVVFLLCMKTPLHAIIAAHELYFS